MEGAPSMTSKIRQRLAGGESGLTLIGRGETSEPTTHAIKHHPFGASAKPAMHASAAPAATSKKHSAAKATTSKPTTPAQPKAPEKPSVVAVALKAGLPLPIARALGQNRVVVVSLYNPYSEVDGISFAEARAGAQLAGAAFVPLNVLSKAEVGKLTGLLGLLPDPGLLVYVRPGRLAIKISGFADKESVAQAAQNAARGS